MTHEKNVICRCPKCNVKLNIDDSKLNKKLICPICNSFFNYPEDIIYYDSPVEESDWLDCYIVKKAV